jgi:Flp pilus assembly protein TadD
MSANPLQQAQTYRQQALELRREDKLSEAIVLLQQATQLAPQDSGGWVLLGWTQHLNGQSEAAAQSLWQAIYHQPTNPEAFNALGIVYLVRGEIAPAIVVHSWASLLKPNNEIAYYNLSLSYQRQNLTDLAILYAKTATNLEPSNPHPLIALALAHWTAQQSEQAESYLRAGLDLNPQYGDRAYLPNLQKAGFSEAQIAQVRSMLERLGR